MCTDTYADKCLQYRSIAHLDFLILQTWWYLLNLIIAVLTLAQRLFAIVLSWSPDGSVGYTDECFHRLDCFDEFSQMLNPKFTCPSWLCPTILGCADCHGRKEVACPSCNKKIEGGTYKSLQFTECPRCYGRGLLAHQDGSDSKSVHYQWSSLSSSLMFIHLHGQIHGLSFLEDFIGIFAVWFCSRSLYSHNVNWSI